MHSEDSIYAPTEEHSENLRLIPELLREIRSLKEFGARALLSMKEAARYTGRSYKTFRREWKSHIWTSVRIGGTGHPKFRPEDLDEDIEQWVLYSKFRKHKRKN